MSEIITRLEAVITARRGANPDESYVAALFDKGRPKIAQKLGEEASEVIVAALSEGEEALRGEAADLLFHLLILLHDSGLSFGDIEDELARREGLSGIAEKAARKG